MTVRRVVGTEVEYGISVKGDPGANPMLLSARVVGAYAASDTPRRKPSWDFTEENPLHDARGFTVAPMMALDHSGIDEDDDPFLANVILTNGARLYVDHAHPEYAAPEVTNPLDAVIWDKAGERVMETAAQRAATVPGEALIGLYKNNTDNKGASYGTHENYLVRRSTPFEALVRHLTPFFISRQIIAGAGRVGLGQDGQTDGFQISQRADFFEVEVGLETTLKRPIINTRDEPHADAEKYRRLHVIIGDANLAETSQYLKIGTTSLILSMIENGYLTEDLSVDDPVHTLHEVSHDPSLKYRLRLRDGRSMSALQLQWLYFERAEAYMREDLDAQTSDILATWHSVLTRLEEDPMLLASELDWVAKLRLLNAYRQRDGLGWASSRLALVDLQYSDIRRDKGLYHRLVHRGSMKRLVTDAQIVAAIDNPPTDTRAYFRGECIRRYGADIAAASWDSLIFDVGGPGLVRVPMLEPLRGTQAHVADLLEASHDAKELVDALTTGPGISK